MSVTEPVFVAVRCVVREMELVKNVLLFLSEVAFVYGYLLSVLSPTRTANKSDEPAHWTCFDDAETVPSYMKVFKDRSAMEGTLGRIDMYIGDLIPRSRRSRRLRTNGLTQQVIKDLVEVSIHELQSQTTIIQKEPFQGIELLYSRIFRKYEFPTGPAVDLAFGGNDRMPTKSGDPKNDGDVALEQPLGRMCGGSEVVLPELRRIVPLLCMCQACICHHALGSRKQFSALDSLRNDSMFASHATLYETSHGSRVPSTVMAGSFTSVWKNSTGVEKRIVEVSLSPSSFHVRLLQNTHPSGYRPDAVWNGVVSSHRLVYFCFAW